MSIQDDEPGGRPKKAGKDENLKKSTKCSQFWVIEKWC